MKDDRNYVRHIKDFITRIYTYTKGGKAEFFASSLVQDAVVRNIELIGEAVKQLSPEIRCSQPTVPWKLIGRMRDKIIHHYFGLDLNLVWEVVEKNIPELEVAIDAIINQLNTALPESPDSSDSAKVE